MFWSLVAEIALCLPLRARYLDRPFADPTLLNSRSALKKYILANNKNVSPGATFDNLFNRVIKGGVEKGEFAQPKGKSIYFPSCHLHDILRNHTSPSSRRLGSAMSNSSCFPCYSCRYRRLVLAYFVPSYLCKDSPLLTHIQVPLAP